LQSQSSSIGNLFNYLLIVLFFQIEGPFIFFDAFIKSLEIFPPNTFFKATFFSTDANMWKSLVPILHQVMAISLQLAAPTLLACLMAEVFLGIANRLAPQVQISFLGMSLKSLVGLFVLWSGWFIIWKQTATESKAWLESFRLLIENLRPFAEKF
jgi:type III secretory pathway component EscT